ncbi:MAG: Na+/H+ antiporter subunit C [Planctomycetota bacterium]|jgi:multicomponent Na+:H+ antiporter subunit C
MYVLLALVIGGLYAAGLYLMMRRSIVKLIFGLVLLGHAANLLIFTTGGLVRGSAPLVPAGATSPPSGHADPIPQALILTAIVIGFAVIAFAAVLIQQVYRTLRTDDSDTMQEAEA